MARYAIIDSDVLTYSIPFSCQTVKDGKIVDLAPDYAVKSRVDQAIAQIVSSAEAKDFKLFLTGSSNYRLDICPNYKGNRKSLDKPHYYQFVRDYLLDSYNAIIVEGIEADDAVCIEYNKAEKEDRSPILCHIDKDIDQLPGLHYRMPTGKKEGYIYEVTPEEGNYYLYSQSLVGDAIDNIIGIKGIGPKTSQKILGHLSDCEVKLYEACLKEYLRDCKETGEERLKKNMQLLYLKRTEDDTWQVPTDS